MQILKLEKKKNKYLITFKNESLLLNEETIIKYNLISKKEVFNLEEIKHFNNLMEEYYKIINKINFKKRTEQEIISYLESKEFEKDDITLIVNKLKNINLLNDELYINAYINDRVLLSKDGYHKIYRDLMKKGLGKEIVIKKLDQVSTDEWLKKLDKEIQAKHKTNRTDSVFFFKQKLTKHLLNLGYEINDIKKVLENYDFKEDLSILKKAYEKLYKKHNDKEKVITKLLQKGFKYEDIKNIEN